MRFVEPNGKKGGGLSIIKLGWFCDAVNGCAEWSIRESETWRRQQARRRTQGTACQQHPFSPHRLSIASHSESCWKQRTNTEAPRLVFRWDSIRASGWKMAMIRRVTRVYMRGTETQTVHPLFALGIHVLLLMGLRERKGSGCWKLLLLRDERERESDITRLWL